MEFNCGHKTFTFSRESLAYYPWLNHLFGNGSIGEPKTTLSFNLIDYLRDVSPHVIRDMLSCLSYLESIYKKNTETKTMTCNMELLIKTEHFLVHGPGMTKGLDIPYKCRFCDKKTMYPTFKVFQQHNIIFNGNNSICKNCGMSWCIGIPNTDYNKCDLLPYPQDECSHEWE